MCRKRKECKADVIKISHLMTNVFKIAEYLTKQTERQVSLSVLCGTYMYILSVITEHRQQCQKSEKAFGNYTYSIGVHISNLVNFLAVKH